MTTLIAVLYFSCFVGLFADKRSQEWALGFAVVWLACLFLGLRYFNGIWSLKISLYYSYFYSTVSSLFFFVNQWKYNSKENFFYSNTNNLLTCWAISAMLQHLSYLILFLVLTFLPFLATYFNPLFLQIYFLHPVFWILMHALLMILMLFKCDKNAQGSVQIRFKNLQATFWASMMGFVLYCANDLFGWIVPV